MKLSDDARKAIHDWRWGPYIHDPVERQAADDKMIKMVIDTFNQLEARIIAEVKDGQAERSLCLQLEADNRLLMHVVHGRAMASSLPKHLKEE